MAAQEGFETRLSALERAIAALQGEAAAIAATGVPRADSALRTLASLQVHTPEGGAVLYSGTVDLPTGGTVQRQHGLSTAEVFTREWSEQAVALSALGHAVRLQMLRAVLNGTTTVSALVETLGHGTSGQVYHHLRELMTAGWLVSNRRGVYEVPASRIVPLLAIVVAAGTPG